MVTRVQQQLSEANVAPQPPPVTPLLLPPTPPPDEAPGIPEQEIPNKEMSALQTLLDTSATSEMDVFLDLRSTALGTIRRTAHQSRPNVTDLGRYVGTMWFLVEHAPHTVQRETARLCMTTLCNIAERYNVSFSKIPNQNALRKLAAKCEEG
jgi:hypothetical protein